MKRTAIKRKSPLKAKSRLQVKTRLRKKRRGAPRKRSGKVKPNPKYLAMIRTLPCLLEGPDCRGVVEAAHVGERGLGQKCPDEETAPLCSHGHHQHGAKSHHVLQKRFWDCHGLNRDKTISYYRSLFSC